MGRRAGRAEAWSSAVRVVRRRGAHFGVAVEGHEDQAPGVERGQARGDHADDEGEAGAAAAVRAGGVGRAR